jgi:hypothetical protein
LSVVCGIYLFQRGGLPITPHSIDWSSRDWLIS